MKTWREIAELTGFSGEALQELEETEKQARGNLSKDGNLQQILKNLTDPFCWEDARKGLKNLLQTDKKGMNMLLCMLTACGYTYEKYENLGISEEIFAETMKCFWRFVQEHQVSYGCYGFDRDFWTGRQLSLQLFRLGELEYEMCTQKEKKTIAVHIPSDADISSEKVQESLHQTREFFERYYPNYRQAPYTCESWLLSPALKDLLPPNSRILNFQALFEVDKVHWASDAVLEWVFQKRGNSLEELPEDTSLQRKMKAYLLDGGKVGEAFGYLKA